ncbi:MAG: hypothetical protein FJW30_06110 [Acidobacteria bacterium]|nr:hypothetical protein [Acidobacteriota bacterium]
MSKFSAWACALALAAQQGAPQLLLHRQGPASIGLFIANADGTNERRLNTESELSYSPTISPDGEWIAFTSEKSGSADLWRIKADGTGLERLTRFAHFEDQPAYSPDGKQIAFVSTRGADITDIWILDLASRNTRNLTTASGGDFRPSWSPDGKWIAFSSDRGTKPRAVLNGAEPLQETSLYIVRPDATEARRLTEEGMFAGSPKWSPDSKRVVFYEMTPEATAPARRDAKEQKDVISQIVSLNIESGERKSHSSSVGLKTSPQYTGPEQIAYLNKTFGLVYTNGRRVPRAARNPVWSKDGKWVVYEKRIPRARKQGERLLSSEPGFDLTYSAEHPALSPDRTRVAVTESGALVTYALDGSDRRVVIPSREKKALGASWSPDGQWIATAYGASFDADWGTSQIAVVHPDGSELTVVTNEPAGAAFPSWAPDSKRIAFRVSGRVHQGLRIVDIAEGKATVLTSERDDYPAWSPAGDAIVFTGYAENDFDLFTIQPDGTGRRRITPTIGVDRYASWAAKGARILFSSDRNGFQDEAPLYDETPNPNLELFMMDADGKNQTRMTSNKWPDLSAAGR